MSYLPVINLVIIFCNKIITSVSKIITSGFVLDLGSQEESDDNFWCFVKLRSSTLYFSTSRNSQVGFWGSVRPKSSIFGAGIRYVTRGGIRSKTIKPDLKSMLGSHSVNSGGKIVFSDHFGVYRAQNPM